MPVGFSTITKTALKAASAAASSIVATGLVLGVVSCSKRDPKIDTAAPGIGQSTSSSGGRGTSTTGGGSRTTGSGNSTVIPPPGGGSGRPTIPSIPGNPSIPGGGSGTRPIIPSIPGNPSIPGGGGGGSRPNVIPNGPTGGGGTRPIIPTPNPVIPGGGASDRNTTQINVPMQIEMSVGGPKVKATLPAGASAVNLQYLSVAGMIEGTTVDVSLAFKSGTKTCVIEKVSVRIEPQSVSVPCK